MNRYERYGKGVRKKGSVPWAYIEQMKMPRPYDWPSVPWTPIGPKKTKSELPWSPIGPKLGLNGPIPTMPEVAIVHGGYIEPVDKGEPRPVGPSRQTVEFTKLSGGLKNIPWHKDRAWKAFLQFFDPYSSSVQGPLTGWENYQLQKYADEHIGGDRYDVPDETATVQRNHWKRKNQSPIPPKPKTDL